MSDEHHTHNAMSASMSDVGPPSYLPSVEEWERILARIEALEARLQEAGLPIFGPSNRDRIDALEKLTDPRWLDDLHTEAHKDLAADVHRLEAQVRELQGHLQELP